VYRSILIVLKLAEFLNMFQYYQILLLESLFSKPIQGPSRDLCGQGSQRTEQNLLAGAKFQAVPLQEGHRLVQNLATQVDGKTNLFHTV